MNLAPMLLFSPEITCRKATSGHSVFPVVLASFSQFKPMGRGLGAALRRLLALAMLLLLLPPLLEPQGALGWAQDSTSSFFGFIGVPGGKPSSPAERQRLRP